MSKPPEEYSVKKARTLEAIRRCAQLPKSRPVHERLGVLHPPLLNIDPDHVVPDELHLLLRIGDVLVRNLIFEMVMADKRMRGSRQTFVSHLKQLESAAHECGVTFRVWEKRDADGKPTGRYDWTSLMGSDVKKILRLLPSKFPELISDAHTQATFSNIWKVQ